MTSKGLLETCTGACPGLCDHRPACVPRIKVDPSKARLCTCPGISAPLTATEITSSEETGADAEEMGAGVEDAGAGVWAGVGADCAPVLEHAATRATAGIAATAHRSRARIITDRPSLDPFLLFQYE